MRVTILANGEPPTAELARTVVDASELLFVTDGAARKALALGLTPDCICGDFDSIDTDLARSLVPSAEILTLSDQNFADIEKTLLLARERGATEIIILGAGGGRIDHAMAAVALLVRYNTELDLTLRFDGSLMRAVSGTSDSPRTLRLRTRPGDGIAVITFHPQNRITLRGVRWPLTDERLPVGTHGVSNVATGDTVEAEMREGCVILCHRFPMETDCPGGG